jgi:hypothetical protein
VTDARRQRTSVLPALALFFLAPLMGAAALLWLAWRRQPKVS